MMPPEMKNFNDEYKELCSELLMKYKNSNAWISFPDGISEEDFIDWIEKQTGQQTVIQYRPDRRDPKVLGILKDSAKIARIEKNEKECYEELRKKLLKEKEFLISIKSPYMYLTSSDLDDIERIRQLTGRRTLVVNTIIYICEENMDLDYYRCEYPMSIWKRPLPVPIRPEDFEI